MVYRLNDLVAQKKNSILTIGRMTPIYLNDIPILENHSRYISRYHCTLELDCELGKWVIRDGQFVTGEIDGHWKSSTNGTYVNSLEVNRLGLIIQPGDIISIGDTKLRVEAY